MGLQKINHHEKKKEKKVPYMANGSELLYVYIYMSMSMCCVCVIRYQYGKNSYKINKKTNKQTYPKTIKQTRKLKQRQRTAN